MSLKVLKKVFIQVLSDIYELNTIENSINTLKIKYYILDLQNFYKTINLYLIGISGENKFIFNTL